MVNRAGRLETIAPLTVVVILVAIFIALSLLVWHRDEAVELDQAGQRLSSSRAVTAVFGSGDGPESDWVSPRAAIRLGAREMVGVLGLMLAALAMGLRDRIGALVALGCPVVVGVLTQYVAKPLINRPDPFGPRAFPSGHAGGITSVAVVATLLVYRRWGFLAALLSVPFTAAPVLLVSFGLLRLQFHHPTDVLGGIVLAPAVVIAATVVMSSYRGPGYKLLGGHGRHSRSAG